METLEDGSFSVETQAPPTFSLVSLDLTNGEEALSAEWDNQAVPVSSDGGHLYRWHMAASTLSALEDLDTVLWDAPIAVGSTTSSIGVREHAGWVLVVPDAEDRRTRHRGSDVFLTALDPSTGEAAPWLADGQGRGYQRVILEDAFVETTVGAGERVVRARRWSDGERLWQRFDDGVTVGAVGDRLYLSEALEDGTRLTHLDVANGDVAWTLILDGTPGLFVAGEDELFVTLREGYVLGVIDPLEGVLTRALPYASTMETGDVQLDDAATPFLGVDKYFVQSAEGYANVRLTARSLDDGRVLWEESFPGFHRVSQAGDRLVLADFDGGRVAPM